MKDTFAFLQVTRVIFVSYEALLYFTAIDFYMKNLQPSWNFSIAQKVL